VPVIPVNHLEAHIMTSRFQTVQDISDFPRVEFPYLSVLCTGKHTQIILTRGVGIHTILGTTCDIAVGELLDRFAQKISTRLQQISDLEIEEFITSHNSLKINQIFNF
jgi:N6-L-threonylcarbamoyladenine synthase